MRRYVIIGTGAVGGTIGGRLAQHGVPVAWVARGEHARVLAAQGMTLRTPDGTEQLSAPVWTGPDDADLTVDDVLVLATKAHQAAEALATWADVPVMHGAEPDGTAGDLLPVLCVTNGIAVEDLALRWFERVYGVCVWCPATYERPGEIIARMSPASGVFHLGTYPVSGRPDDLARSVAADWEGARLEVPLPHDVMAWKRRKLVANMLNAVDALVAPGEDATELQRVCVAEARAALVASGDPITDDTEAEHLRARGPQVAPVPGAPDIGSSTFQSLARGAGSVETDYLNGEIVRLGRLHGVPTPVNAALAHLARRAAREGWSPRSLSAQDVGAVVDRHRRSID